MGGAYLAKHARLPPRLATPFSKKCFDRCVGLIRKQAPSKNLGAIDYLIERLDLGTTRTGFRHDIVPYHLR